MRFLPRHSGRRAVLAALFACLCLAPLLAGCAEDRGNLIPKSASDSLIAKINKVQELAANGECFAAVDVAASARAEVEALDGDIDTRLKRSLVNGVNQLQGFVSDPEKCTESETNTEEPPDIEETPTGTEGATGETGTTDTGTTTTGDQGTTTDDEQDQNKNQGNGKPPPPSTPTGPNKPDNGNPTKPTPPVTPPDTGPGSGGIGPG